MTKPRCVIPDEIRGVPMGHHSDDLVTVYHGSTEPLTACGFHWRYYHQECLEAERERRRHVQPAPESHR